jgi:hypothetical protein
MLGEGTLLQQTLEHLVQKIPANRIVIVTNAVQEESMKLQAGIAKEIPHRLENPEQIPLEVIEIQNGPYLEEDDIVRLQDDFDRLRPIGF